jgi:hypothetical protein
VIDKRRNYCSRKQQENAAKLTQVLDGRDDEENSHVAPRLIKNED